MDRANPLIAATAINLIMFLPHTCQRALFTERAAFVVTVHTGGPGPAGVMLTYSLHLLFR